MNNGEFKKLDSEIISDEEAKILRKECREYEELLHVSLVEHPKHYNIGSIEVWDAIIEWKLDFLLGSAVKYIARAGHKVDAIEDLRKAVQFIEKEIEVLKREVS